MGWDTVGGDGASHGVRSFTLFFSCRGFDCKHLQIQIQIIRYGVFAYE